MMKKGKKKMALQRKTLWLWIYGVAITMSFLIVSFLAAEIYYRDRYYKEATENAVATDAIDIVRDLNGKHERILLESKNSYIKFCDTLIYAQKSKDACDLFFSKKQNVKPLINESDEKLLKAFQAVHTESERYEAYVNSHELGYGIRWTHELGTPYMFIFMFACIGLGASTLGSLLMQSCDFEDKQDIERITSLILGPVTAMVSALLLVYVFVPSENVDLMFKKRLLNVPVSVYVFSFLFSVSPASSISNFAEFSKRQISMLAGKKSEARE
jgi:hypothetical protein